MLDADNCQKKEDSVMRPLQVVTSYAHATSKTELVDIHEIMSEYESIYNRLASSNDGECYIVIAVRNNKPVLLKTVMH